MQKKTVAICTLGCKVNQYESEAIAEALEADGFVVAPFEDVCDAYIVNTCTVTAESDRKARQMIRRAVRKNPDAVVVVMGCFSQVAPESVAKIEGVSLVMGNTEKLSVPARIDRLLEAKKTAPELAVSDIFEAPFERMAVTRQTDGRTRRTRAFVKIEDGCENRCAYCIIPKARGAVRSKPIADVLCEVEHLAQSGIREVVLTGIETASYGRDLPEQDALATLIEAVDKIAGIDRIRLGSLDPSLMRPAFVDRVAKCAHLVPHFHLSMQSGSSTVLARMRRKYNAGQVLENLAYLREAMVGVQFATDLIVGFPGETDAEFEETLAFVREARFLTAHVFAYSRRKGTEADRMSGQVAEDVKAARSHALIEAQRKITEDILDTHVKSAPTEDVLFETYKGGIATGHTRAFMEVSVASTVPLGGEIRAVKLTERRGQTLFGVLNG